MSEEITITKEDLALWLDRPPSNDDLDLCEYLANAVQNRQKYYEENKQLKEDYSKLLETSKAYKKLLKTTMQKEHNAMKVLDEIREYIDEFPCIHYSSIEKVDGKRLSGKLLPIDNLLQILDKAGKE